MKKRIFDILISIVLIIILFLPITIICLLVLISSKGPIFYFSERVGLNNKNFKMPKFRTMYVDTPLLDTASLDNPSQYITLIGSFLRKFSIDELPQIYSVLIGDMSLVGPRPALPSQYELIRLRTLSGAYKCKPGITGLAQVKGRDNISIEEKASLDQRYYQNKSLIYDIYIIILTFLVVINKKNISH